ncbi:hypothetical protein D8I24_3047 (plasmid) [Cupriavidus necator H850]|nr:hypothetical protein D8I24_3047 [Cupriavidus necator H850]
MRPAEAAFCRLVVTFGVVTSAIVDRYQPLCPTERYFLVTDDHRYNWHLNALLEGRTWR